MLLYPRSFPPPFAQSPHLSAWVSGLEHARPRPRTPPIPPHTSPHTPPPRSVQVDRVLGDGKPTWEQVRELRYCTRVIAEAMRLYPQPPVLIR